MSTALAVPRQQSIEAEARSWSRIHSTDRCSRCSGLMVAEWCQDLSDYTGQRCLQCGELIDPVILQNRRLQFGSAFGPGQK
jgi:DNA-directed RNA polymerase subunit RPC12/RpoP